MSLDFHPRKMDLLCSSDCNDEIRFWDMKDYNCLRVFKVIFLYLFKLNILRHCSSILILVIMCDYPVLWKNKRFHINFLHLLKFSTFGVCLLLHVIYFATCFTPT